MPFIFHFKHGGFTIKKYHETLDKLSAAGLGSPKGRSYHVCYGDPNNLEVTDVWTSEEEFQEFGQTLMPILAAMDIELGQPEKSEVHNIIVGVPATAQATI